MLCLWWGMRGALLILPQYSVAFTVESLSLVNLLFIFRLVCTRRRYIDRLGIFHANQTSICLDRHYK